MWRLSGFKGYPPQALWKLIVFACTDSLMEKPFHELCNRLTVVFWLKRRQLWLDPRHCWPANQDGALQTSQSYHQYFWTSGSNHRRGGATSRPHRLHHKWLESDFYLQVLILTLLLTWHQATTLHCIPPSDRRTKRVTKQHDRSILLCLRKLGAKWLSTALINGGICLQHLRNANTGHTPFELNCGHQPQILYKEDVNPYSQSKSADELGEEVKELIIVCCKNFYHAQEFQK